MVGLAQVGGEPVVVVDLKELIEGRAGAEDHRFILLMNTPGRDSAVGLAIDEALEMSCRVACRQPRSTATGTRSAGRYRFEGRPVRIVDPERVVGPSSSSGSGGAPE